MVVLPTPLTPTTIITCGFLFEGMVNSVSLPKFISDNSPAISSRRIVLRSSVPIYLSLATLTSILLMILSVVSTPTSDAIKTSSKLSKTSSSTLDFPATAFVNLPKKLSLDFSKLLSKVSLFSFEKIFLKKLIFISYTL